MPRPCESSASSAIDLPFSKAIKPWRNSIASSCSAQGRTEEHMGKPKMQLVKTSGPSIHLITSIKGAERFDSLRKKPPVGPLADEIKPWRDNSWSIFAKKCRGTARASDSSLTPILCSALLWAAKCSTALMPYLQGLLNTIATVLKQGHLPLPEWFNSWQCKGRLFKRQKHLLILLYWHDKYQCQK